MQKRLRALWSCNAFIGRAWGLSPKMPLLLFKRVIIPKITYAIVAWWNIMDTALARSELECLPGGACTMITGAMRSTSTKVLEMLLDLPTLGMAVESAALMAAYRLLRINLPRYRYYRIGIQTFAITTLKCLSRQIVCLFGQEVYLPRSTQFSHKYCQWCCI